MPFAFIPLGWVGFIRFFYLFFFRLFRLLGTIRIVIWASCTGIVWILKKWL